MNISVYTVSRHSLRVYKRYLVWTRCTHNGTTQRRLSWQRSPVATWIW